MLVESVPVVERSHINHVDPTKSGWRVIWEGAVCAFDLIGHPTATRAHAWSTSFPGTDPRRFVAVLHSPPVDSPVAAVRASIVSDIKGGRFDWDRIGQTGANLGHRPASGW